MSEDTSAVVVRPTMEAQGRASMLKETDIFDSAMVPKEGDSQAEIDAKMMNLKTAISLRRKQERPWPPVVTIANPDRTEDYWEGFDVGVISGQKRGVLQLREAILQGSRLLAVVFIVTRGRYGSI